MTQTLGRFARRSQAAADARKIASILLETGEAAPITTKAGATAGGDERKLRGIPAQARGVAGAISIHIGHRSASLGSDAHLDSIR